MSPDPHGTVGIVRGWWGDASTVSPGPHGTVGIVRGWWGDVSTVSPGPHGTVGIVLPTSLSQYLLFHEDLETQ